MSLLILAACTENNSDPKIDEYLQYGEESHYHTGHEHMNHSSDGTLPEGVKEAETPAFAVGSIARMEAGHMPGMNGVEATIVGAYETIAYAVSYIPTDGGAPVRFHKWVIHEELQLDNNEQIKENDKVILNADHMKGMEGAVATIDFMEKTTVYMVDFTLRSGEEVKNHKWVTESELVKND